MTITQNFIIQWLVHFELSYFPCWIVWVASSKLCVLEFVKKSYFHDKWLSPKIVHAKLVTKDLGPKECLDGVKILFWFVFYLLFLFLCLAIGILHTIQTKTFRCSYHVNKVPNLETMVCEKVEIMEYVHLPIPYEIQWTHVWVEHFVNKETYIW
jgi:hypothetical protein